MTIREANERILTLMSEYLCFSPTAIQPTEVTAQADSHSLSHSEAYRMLLAARCGLNLDHPADAQLYRTYFLQMVHHHVPVTYLSDAYYQAVRPEGIRYGDVDLVYETLQPMELFIVDDFRRDAQGRLFPQLGWFSEPFTFPALRENGLVWMTVTPNEINTIQPIVRQTRGRVLTYGLGLGYYAFHALLRDDVTSVTVVENNPQVIEIFRRLLLPSFPRRKDLHIIEADAFEYAQHIMPQEGYDTVFTDLWHDVSDGIPLYQRMKALETPGPRYFYWIEKTLRCYID